jgi:hypothetical protein
MQELAEEARACWEDRAVYYAGAGGRGKSLLGRQGSLLCRSWRKRQELAGKTGQSTMPTTNLAGEAFEALDEMKWSRRDCTEYQDELNWEMRAFRRINGELEPSEMSAKMRRAA